MHNWFGIRIDIMQLAPSLGAVRHTGMQVLHACGSYHFHNCPG